MRRSKEGEVNRCWIRDVIARNGILRGAGSGGCWCDTTYRGSVLSVFECGTVYPRSVFVVRDECSIKPSCRDGREDAE